VKGDRKEREQSREKKEQRSTKNTPAKNEGT
jgi:hypothetical protein